MYAIWICKQLIMQLAYTVTSVIYGYLKTILIDKKTIVYTKPKKLYEDMLNKILDGFIIVKLLDIRLTIIKK